ncbi:dihydropteroate synthase [Shewanella amazonensis]|uniref:Dihydropteroate synthase n=1 Tax=Shewanella amazonensis (strain ATCC BAA-1098 / SB2B) TaxID=326297 RepID=A1S456_SHEAM|nr:dihydropteroate synthase [Shewanella amazonensis]ABL99162.1 Dihydropteroate synthase [Shewanella amazonensis SB2B]
MFTLTAREKTLDLSRPVVMGILNVTPDSFSDGGQFAAFERACEHADQLVTEGAAIIDIGGESTRPGAAEVSLDEEISRVIPLVEYVSKTHDVWVSVDTSKAGVMSEAAKAGAHLINDVRALMEPGALEAAAVSGLAVCLMHMQGQPRTMQQNPEYDNLIEDVCTFFEHRIAACVDAGIPRAQIILDPGFGFGKTVSHNYELLARFAEFERFGLPLLAGLSRKSMLGNLLGRDATSRLAGSLAGALLSAQQGANIIRVHDVAETIDVLKVLEATREYKHL